MIGRRSVRLVSPSEPSGGLGMARVSRAGAAGTRALVGLAGFAAILSAASPRPSQASYLETLGLGSRAISLGNAFVAVADDLSANYYNPAGLTQLIGGPSADIGVGVGLTGIRLQYTETIVDSLSRVRPGQTVHMDPEFPDWIPQPFLPSGFELTDRLYVTPFTIQTPFAGTTQWPSSFGDGRFSAAEAGQIFITWSPTLAAKVTDWLSLGLGFDLLIGDDVWQKAVFGDGALGQSISKSVFGKPDSPLTPIVNTSNGIDDGYTLLRAEQRFPTGISPINDIDLDFHTPGFRLGVMLFPNDWLRIGAAYKSKLNPEVQGSIETHWEQAILDQPVFKAVGIRDDKDHMKLDFPLPQRISGGLSFRLSDAWMVTTEYEFTDWAHARVTDRIRIVNGGLNPNLLTPKGIQEIVIPRNPGSTHSGRVGLEWKPVDPWVITSGFWYDPSPARDKFFEFGTDPGDRLLVSAGLGLAGILDGMLDVTTHFQYAFIVPRHIGLGESELAGGSRNIGIPDANGVSSGNFGPNDTFAFETGGHIMNVGVLFTIHR